MAARDGRDPQSGALAGLPEPKPDGRPDAARGTVGSAHGAAQPSTIVSIGYEGRTAEELVTALVGAGASTLVDVRENAVSRKPGLSKKALAARCEADGIGYVHEPTLGNPRANRAGLRERRPESLSAYEAHLAGTGADALDRVAALLRGRTVGLLCFEADPGSCHRSIVAEHLLARDPRASVRTA